MAIYSDLNRLQDRQDEMRWRLARRKERKKLVQKRENKKVFSPLKSKTSKQII